MTKSKKINPRRRPATEADVKRAKDKAAQDGLELAIYIVLYALIDKHNAPKEDIQQLGEDITYISDSINKGYLKVNDIKQLLRDEYDFTWE